MNITTCPVEKCTGCSACANICNKAAIEMKEDEIGHLYPTVIEAKCVNCGLCEKICPAVHPIQLNVTPSRAYALVDNDDNERSTSSSGGAASIICRSIIKQKGVVYGCAQVDSLIFIRHIRVDNEKDLMSLKGSKYVQSAIGDTYLQVQKDLNSGLFVAFVGTPCQCAGLLSFLRKRYEKLVILDLICHGVPSQKMLIENAMFNGITDLEHTKVDFRRKTGSNIQFGQYYHVMKGKYCVEKNTPQDDFMAAFMTGLSFRECCHTCRYSSSTRVGDITIGDFWRLGAKKKTKFNIKNGISLVLVNTAKGQKIFESILPNTSFEVRSYDEAAEGNPNLNHASHRLRNKDLFREVYKKEGLHEAVKKAIPRSLYYKMAFIERIQQVSFIVITFKFLRLTVNRIFGR